MVNHLIDINLLETMQSSDKLALMDDIDKLLSQGINHCVHLPQLMRRSILREEFRPGNYLRDPIPY